MYVNNGIFFYLYNFFFVISLYFEMISYLKLSRKINVRAFWTRKHNNSICIFISRCSYLVIIVFFLLLMRFAGTNLMLLAVVGALQLKYVAYNGKRLRLLLLSFQTYVYLLNFVV